MEPECILAVMRDMVLEGLEGLDDERRAQWRERLLSPIPAAADLPRIGWKFLHWLVSEHIVLADNADAEIQAVTVQTRSALSQTAQVLLPLTRGEPVDAEAAHAAEDTAAAIVARAEGITSTAPTAREALAAFLVAAAADSAAYAADTAYSASAAAAADTVCAAARASQPESDATASYEAQASKLLELLAQA